MRAPLMSPLRRVSPASVTPQPHAPGDNLRGALLMTLSMIGFGCNDAAMKFVTQDMPLYQAITMRGLTMMVVLWALALREGGLSLAVGRGNRWSMVLRALGEVGSTLLFLNALQVMAIGDLSAVMQSLPLVVMLAAAMFFGERLGPRRLGAVLVGLVGVMMILRPGSGTFGIWALVALGSVLLMVLRDIVTKMFSRDVSSTTIAFYAALSVTVMGGVLALGQGAIMPNLQHLLLLLLASAFLTMGYVTGVAAMRVGEISYVAPFRYTSLIVAIAAGVAIFGEWPDIWTWLGSALVVAAGIYVIWREAQLEKQ
ncbi:DMT family transporter [Paracoccus seriniphilus]|uniref:Permease of the drug/metabolite transporter (DMT) superfamily n=1 Tax=Paracoccus seriniphilus TaxID=184748 RepID=A0A239Q2H4_9RHOB|nr:DMT family transporter [Paracoccus seriniphilus]WCR14470.1 DMT family transporter [Paracoccus seriniphilus]SNT76413.1 Permease of the drug/metabolite transporter (DMT) superfamily [Paracoccus seriniphilus]